MIANGGRDGHQKRGVNLGVRRIGGGVFGSGLYGVPHSIDLQFEPMGEHRLQLGESLCGGFLNTADTCDGSKSDRHCDCLVIVEQQWREFCANS